LLYLEPRTVLEYGSLVKAKAKAEIQEEGHLQPEVIWRSLEIPRQAIEIREWGKRIENEWLFDLG